MLTTGAGVSVQRRGVVVHFGRAPAHGRPISNRICAGLFNCCNYICHFSVFQKGSVRRCGGWVLTRRQPDHDLFLKPRASGPCLCMSPAGCRYYWRSIEGLISGGTGAKSMWLCECGQTRQGDPAHGRKGRGGSLSPSTCWWSMPRWNRLSAVSGVGIVGEAVLSGRYHPACGYA